MNETLEQRDAREREAEIRRAAGRCADANNGEVQIDAHDFAFLLSLLDEARAANALKCGAVSPISSVQHLSGGTSPVRCQLPPGHVGNHRGIYGEWSWYCSDCGPQRNACCVAAVPKFAAPSLSESTEETSND